MTAPLDSMRLALRHLNGGSDSLTGAEHFGAYTGMRSAIPAFENLIQRAEELLAVIYGVSPDFKNGVTDATGTIDEGETYAICAISELEYALKLVKDGDA